MRINKILRTSVGADLSALAGCSSIRIHLLINIIAPLLIQISFEIQPGCYEFQRTVPLCSAELTLCLKLRSGVSGIVISVI